MINKTGKYVNIKDYIIGLSILLTYIDTLYSYQQPSDINIYLGNPSEYCDNEAPYFHGKIDSAGFSDWIWYGKSPNHPGRKWDILLFRCLLTYKSSYHYHLSVPSVSAAV